MQAPAQHWKQRTPPDPPQGPCRSHLAWTPSPCKPSPSSHVPNMLAAQHMPPGPALPHNQGMASALPPGDSPTFNFPNHSFGRLSLPFKYECLRMASVAAMPCGNESNACQLTWHTAECDLAAWHRQQCVEQGQGPCCYLLPPGPQGCLQLR